MNNITTVQIIQFLKNLFNNLTIRLKKFRHIVIIIKSLNPIDNKSTIIQFIIILK